MIKTTIEFKRKGKKEEERFIRKMIKTTIELNWKKKKKIVHVVK